MFRSRSVEVTEQLSLGCLILLLVLSYVSRALSLSGVSLDVLLSLSLLVVASPAVAALSFGVIDVLNRSREDLLDLDFDYLEEEEESEESEEEESEEEGERGERGEKGEKGEGDGEGGEKEKRRKGQKEGDRKGKERKSPSSPSSEGGGAKKRGGERESAPKKRETERSPLPEDGPALPKGYLPPIESPRIGAVPLPQGVEREGEREGEGEGEGGGGGERGKEREGGEKIRVRVVTTMKGEGGEGTKKLLKLKKGDKEKILKAREEQKKGEQKPNIYIKKQETKKRES